MRFAVAICLCVALLPGVVLGGQSQPLSPSAAKDSQKPQPKSRQQHQKANKNQPGTETTPFFVKVINTPTVEIGPRKNENPAEKDSLADWWMVWLTGALTFIGSVQAILFICQLIYIRRSVEDTNIAARAAQKAADATVNNERPVLSLKMQLFYIRDPISAAKLSLREGIIPEHNVIEIHFNNCGKTPAILRSIKLEWMVCRNLPLQPQYHRAESKFGAGVHVVTGQSMQVQPEDFVISLTNQQRRDILDGRAYLWVYGTLFFDVFQDTDGPHPYPFCMKYLFSRINPRGSFGFVHDQSIPEAYAINR